MTKGLTLFGGPDEPRWTTTDLNTRAPLRTCIVNDADARALVVPLTGACLRSPDARETTAWDSYDHFLRAPRAAPWLV